MKNINELFKSKNNMIIYVLFLMVILILYNTIYKIAFSMEGLQGNEDLIYIVVHSTFPINMTLYDIRFYMYLYLPFFLYSTTLPKIEDLYVVRVKRKLMFRITYFNLIKKSIFIILIFMLLDILLAFIYLDLLTLLRNILPFILQIVLLYTYILTNIIIREIINIKFNVNSIIIVIILNVIFLSLFGSAFSKMNVFDSGIFASIILLIQFIFLWIILSYIYFYMFISRDYV